MEWSKIKNIILLILLITNLFLLCLVGFQRWNTAHYQSGARADALSVLAKNRIEMDKDALPNDLSLPLASVTRDREGEAAMLAPLLGQVTEEALGGGQFLYSSEKGQAYLRSRGEFTITLTPGSYPLSGDMGDHALDMMELMGFEGMVVSTDADADSGSVILLQLWNDVPILTCRVQVTYHEGMLTSISGVRLTGTPTDTGTLELSAVTGLLRFLEQFIESGDVCSQVTVMQAGYQLTSGLSDPATLTPIWYFMTDSGAYTLDAVTAELKKQ